MKAAAQVRAPTETTAEIPTRDPLLDVAFARCRRIDRMREEDGEATLDMRRGCDHHSLVRGRFLCPPDHRSSGADGVSNSQRGRRAPEEG
jgi:hypothetical protein